LVCFVCCKEADFFFLHTDIKKHFAFDFGKTHHHQPQMSCSIKGCTSKNIGYKKEMLCIAHNSQRKRKLSRQSLTDGDAKRARGADEGDVEDDAAAACEVQWAHLEPFGHPPLCIPMISLSVLLEVATCGVGAGVTIPSDQPVAETCWLRNTGAFHCLSRLAIPSRIEDLTGREELKVVVALQRRADRLTSIFALGTRLVAGPITERSNFILEAVVATVLLLEVAVTAAEDRARDYSMIADGGSTAWDQQFVRRELEDAMHPTCRLCGRFTFAVLDQNDGTCPRCGTRSCLVCFSPNDCHSLHEHMTLTFARIRLHGHSGPGMLTKPSVLDLDSVVCTAAEDSGGTAVLRSTRRLVGLCALLGMHRVRLAVAPLLTSHHWIATAMKAMEEPNALNTPAWVDGISSQIQKEFRHASNH
jgi:hypothetical protein